MKTNADSSKNNENKFILALVTHPCPTQEYQIRWGYFLNMFKRTINIYSAWSLIIQSMRFQSS